MHSALRAQVAFRITGLRSPDQCPSTDARGLRPALTARLRNLAALRYDFPLVLPPNPGDGAFAVPLTEAVDRLLDKIAPPGAEDASETRQSVLCLEREIRRLLANGASGTLAALWELAARRLAARDAAALPQSLERARKALEIDGPLHDCDATLPGEFLLRAWNMLHRKKAERFHAEIQRLIAGLGEILAADEARSPQARSAERLREAFGSVDRETLDFEAMSRLLARSGGKRPLSEARRRRVRALLVQLESQRFFLDDSGFTFTFDRGGLALRTFRARYARLRSLARGMAVARLEVAGEYDEKRHDALFKQMRQSPLTHEELARFPDYLVRVREEELDPDARAELFDLLTSGMPVKLLVQTDDILDGASAADSLCGVANRSDATTGMALGLVNVFVLQTSASNLYRLADKVVEGLEYAGPSLFSVYSGAPGDTACLPPYLNSAAASESRAFPTFTYDPRKPLEGGSRFSLENNPQPDRDWPVHRFEYEDAAHQRAVEELPFTLADFAAADERFAHHFLPVAEVAPGAPAAIAMTDDHDMLHRIVVDEAMDGLTQRALDRWHRLQKLATMGAAPAAVVLAEPQPVPQVEAKAEALAAPAAAPDAANAATSDDAYIETPRCTTCNECTELNNRMFAYDGNKQAYIADVSAGTYRQLVEAAEACQVSIIHPGKPRNPDEPGLEELVERAAIFR
jgi:hypothetical protein